MKNLLVISSSFPPDASIAAKRPYKLVQNISKLGWNPHVLCLEPSCYHETDVELGKDIFHSVPVTQVSCKSPWSHAKLWREKYSRGVSSHLARLTSAGAKASQPYIPFDDRYTWALRATKTGVNIVRRNNIDLIWATAPLLSNLYLAYRVAKKTGIPYIVDYRDVYPAGLVNKSHLCNRYNYKLENEIVQHSSGISFTAPEQENVLLKKFTSTQTKPRCLIYNWFDLSQSSHLAPQTHSFFSIIHGGSLYMGTRKLDGFFEALALIKKQAPDGLKNMKFQQYGYHAGLTYLEDLRTQLGLGETVEFRERLTHDTFVSMCKGADILLLVIGHDTELNQHAGAIPGKLYDYFAACRPILVIGPEGCEAGKMVMKLNRGIAVPDDNAPQIAEAISLLAQKKVPRGELDVSMDAVRDYESKAAIEKMAVFFNRVHNDNQTMSPGNKS